METLYVKSAMKRQRKFQIRTKITNIEGIKWVEKEAASSESVSHIFRIYENIKWAEKIYGEKAVTGKLVGDVLVMPFYESVSLENKLNDCIWETDVKKIESLFQLWRELIIGNGDNLCKFISCNEFERIFGIAIELSGDDAVAVANVDCSSENILFLKDGQIKIIDYEWIFRFPVPIDFIFYRVLKMFYQRSNKVIGWKVLLHYSGIQLEKIDVYEKLMNNFYKYIILDDRNGVDYGQLGNQFKVAQIRKMNHLYKYKLPELEIPSKSGLIIYGAGRVGVDYFEQIRDTGNYEIVAWVDKRASWYRRQGMEIADCEIMKNINYDYILICVLRENVAQEIKLELMGMNIEEKKIVWKRAETD
jgi:hypothetical protein